jgi:hypothetical protein
MKKGDGKLDKWPEITIEHRCYDREVHEGATNLAGDVLERVFVAVDPESYIN